VTIATIKSKAKRRPALGVALTGKAARQMERRPPGRVSTAEAAAAATATRPARASSQGSSAGASGAGRSGLLVPHVPIALEAAAAKMADA
jgi:hypothetical protein